LRRDRDYRYFEQPAGIATASSTLTLREATYDEPIQRGDSEMETLTQMKCVACRKDAPTVTDAEIAEFHPQVSGWEEWSSIESNA
jgi:hypothetical protein